MNDKAYLVLSVADLKYMLKKAQSNAKANGFVGREQNKWCVVYRDIEISQEASGLQIGSYSLRQASANID